MTWTRLHRAIHEGAAERTGRDERLALAAGVGTSLGLLALGLAIYLFDHTKGDRAISVRILATGLLVLAATPILRLVPLGARYARRRAWLCVALTTGVALLALSGLALGLFRFPAR